MKGGGGFSLSFYFSVMNADKLVSGAILGFDGEAVEINGIVYIIKPPTIAKIAGASYWLSDISKISSFEDLFASLKDLNVISKALSWFINGDESLCDELSKGTMDEVVDALEKAFSMVSAENFTRLLTLAKNVARLTANPRP